MEPKGGDSELVSFIMHDINLKVPAYRYHKERPEYLFLWYNFLSTCLTTQGRQYLHASHQAAICLNVHKASS